MKRSISIFMALVVGFAFATTAGAAAEPKPSIEDVVGDGNGINDQGAGDGSFGDFNQTGGPSTVGDLTGVIFTNDAKNIYVHLQTVASPPATQGTGYRVRVNPDGAGGSYCLYFESFHPGATNNLTANEGHLRDACTGEVIEATVAPSVLGGTMITVPRKAHEAFGKGKKLTAPQAATFVYSGSSYPAGAMGPFLDTTKPGTDYALKK